MSLITHAKIFGMFALLFLVTGKCSVTSPSEQQTNSTNNRASTNNTSQLKQHEIVFHKPRIKSGSFEQLPAPIEIRDAKIMEKGHNKGDLQVEILNVSGKPIVATTLTFSSPDCGKFVLYGGPTEINWGDTSLFGKPANAIRTDGIPTLKPSETGVIVFKRQLLGKFLRPDYYEGCKPEESYSYLGVMLIRFEDGTEWSFKNEVEKYKANR